MKAVKELYTSTGDHMIMFRSVFRNTEELSEFMKKIESIEGVTKVCPAILMERVK